MCLFRVKKDEKYEVCYFCGEDVNESNPYIYKIIGLGKYDNKYICTDCLLDKLSK
tara:strand:+ start:1693 stop:1857 length:165 start_codon:yes stop_codon:yes gene_type:complete